MIFNIRHPDIRHQPSTSLTTIVDAATTSLTVGNTGGFTASKYLLIGGYGSATAEIKLGGAITTTTLATAATSFLHSAGDVVFQIPYNQIEISYSTNLVTLWESNLYATLSDAMTAATWTTLATIDITPTQDETFYNDTISGRAYRWRYKHSDGTPAYSDYQNILLPTGYEEKSVAAIIRKAISITNKKISNDILAQINTEFCFDEINQCLRWVDNKRLYWSHNQSFNTVLSEITSGKNEYILPTNIATRDNKQAIWNLKIEDGYNLTYLDKREMDQYFVDVHTSFLAVALTSASTTATFDDTSNFADSGTFDVWVAGVKMTITYTANNRTTNVLTCPSCATEVTATAAIDTMVLQGASYGTPNYYTVYDGKIIFNIVPNDTIYQRAITADYYLNVQQVNSEDDYVRIENPNLVINWLRKAISLKTNNDTKAAQYDAMLREDLKDMKFKNSTGQKQYLKPRGWTYVGSRYNYPNN